MQFVLCYMDYGKSALPNQEQSAFSISKAIISF